MADIKQIINNQKLSISSKIQYNYFSDIIILHYNYSQILKNINKDTIVVIIKKLALK